MTIRLHPLPPTPFSEDEEIQALGREVIDDEMAFSIVYTNAYDQHFFCLFVCLFVIVRLA